jgi:hypothetical protein
MTRQREPGLLTPERMIVAAVAEDREPHASEVVYLFRTLQHFGGRMSRARQIAYFLESADHPSTRRLADLGVTVKVVERVDARCPYSNKVRMLEEAEDSDYVVALDTDVVITRDFSPYVQGSGVAAKPAGKIRLSMDEWEKVFDYFGLEIPQARYFTTARIDETIPYFNAGVVIVPTQHLSTFRTEWQSFTRRLLDAYPDLPQVAAHPVFVDEFALSLALTSARLPFRALPLAMNFPTDRRVDPLLEPRKVAPYILHHHHRVSPNGELLACKYEEINAVIDKVNECLRSPELAGDRESAQAGR